MFKLYILYCQTPNRFYIGHTTDVEKRLAEHNAAYPLSLQKLMIGY